jgi:hypothetical protein
MTGTRCHHHDVAVAFIGIRRSCVAHVWELFLGPACWLVLSDKLNDTSIVIWNGSSEDAYLFSFGCFC